MKRDLGDGLLLRTATPADTEALATFNARIHAEPDDPGPDAVIEGWTRDLFSRHPTFRPEDFTIVEDTRTGAIVSSLNLISQTWTYGGVPFGVGRIELVGTDDVYRRRGLIRTQFDVVHTWSRERGELAQGITGIPWYYRQFGYEYALALEGGERAPRDRLPDPATAPADAGYRVRPATEADAPFIVATDARARERYLVSVVRDEVLWRFEIAGRGERIWAVAIIESAAGEPAGFVAHGWRLQGTALIVRSCELAAGVSWLAVKDALLRYLRATGERCEQDGGARRFARVTFLMEHDHPLYEVMPEALDGTQPSYAWYIRVPDLPAFLLRVAPVLERRLAGSVAGGYSGEIRLTFYRDGLRLAFERGRLTGAELWSRPERHEASVCFPDLTFLQLLFGHRSFDELESFLPDCSARTEEGRVLMRTLFPKQPSLVWGVA